MRTSINHNTTYCALVCKPDRQAFKLWLAKVGYERIEETELAFDRAMQTYLKKGYTREWVNQRLKSIEVRKELTDEWQDRGVQEGLEYAILTDEITKAWADKSVKEYKKLKGLKKQNLRIAVPGLASRIYHRIAVPGLASRIYHRIAVPGLASRIYQNRGARIAVPGLASRIYDT